MERGGAGDGDFRFVLEILHIFMDLQSMTRTVSVHVLSSQGLG